MAVFITQTPTPTHMLSKKSLWLALSVAAGLCTGTAVAQDSGPLIDLLVKKGIVNSQEGEELRSEMVRDSKLF